MSDDVVVYPGVLSSGGVDESQQVELGGTRTLAQVLGEEPRPAGDEDHIDEKEWDQTDGKRPGPIPQWALSVGTQTIQVSGEETPSPLDLPTWARVPGNRTLLVTDKDPAADMPKWAKEGLKHPTPAFGLDNYSADDMPEWAKKGLATDEDQPIVVHDIEYAEEGHGSRPHPSDSSVGTLINDNVTRSVDQRGVVKGRSHPSDASVACLLKDSVDASNIPATDQVDGKEKLSTSHTETNVDTCLESQVKSAETNVIASQESAKVKPHVGDETDAVNTQRTSAKIKPHVGDETETVSTQRASVKMSAVNMAMKESEPQSDTRHIHTVGDKHISQQTTHELDPNKPHIKMSDNMKATTESKASDDQFTTRKKMVGSQHASVESEGQIVEKPHLRIHPTLHANLQSQPDVILFNKQSRFGHVSQLSNLEQSFLAPKMKRTPWHVSEESGDWACYLIKPGRKQKAKTKEYIPENDIDGPSTFRPHIRINEKWHASMESAHVDVDQNRLEKFKAHNVYGHSSDSTVQKLLYGDGYHNNPFIVHSPKIKIGETFINKKNSKLHLIIYLL